MRSRAVKRLSDNRNPVEYMPGLQGPNQLAVRRRQTLECRRRLWLSWWQRLLAWKKGCGNNEEELLISDMSQAHHRYNKAPVCEFEDAHSICFLFRGVVPGGTIGVRLGC